MTACLFAKSVYEPLYLYPTSSAEQFTMSEQSAGALCLPCLPLGRQSRSDATSLGKLSLSSTLPPVGRTSSLGYVLLMASPHFIVAFITIWVTDTLLTLPSLL